MAINKIKTGDEVILIAGRNKGMRGTVKARVGLDKLLVEGVNLVSKHVRPNPNAGEQGGIKKLEAPVHVSNVAIYNPQTNKADRVGVTVLADGEKKRHFKSNNEVIDV